MANKIDVKDVNVYYGPDHTLKDVSLSIKKNTVTALIGPSGCGKVHGFCVYSTA